MDDSKRQHSETIDDVNPTIYSEKAGVADYKADAIEAESEELNMTVLEAVKAYPMASFWAFIFSCTIVSSIPSLSPLREGTALKRQPG